MPDPVERLLRQVDPAAAEANSEALLDGQAGLFGLRPHAVEPVDDATGPALPRHAAGGDVTQPALRDLRAAASDVGGGHGHDSSFGSQSAARLRARYSLW